MKKKTKKLKELYKLEDRPNDRSAGILLHITSLPSPFGIGDFGTWARRFADFLYKNHQRYWQLLPLNPIEQGQGYSPYSSISSVAGNTLLISPELLAQEKLLDFKTLKKNQLPTGNHVNYQKAEQVKEVLLNKAYNNFLKGKFTALKQDFKNFIHREQYWLNDVALYVALKHYHQGKPWYEWPSAFKFRDNKTIRDFSKKNEETLNKIKWLQFIFMKQWKELRSYCNERNIKIFGDLPFYVSYDSVDVWSHPDIFSLDKNRNMTGIAGVPPDYFNDNGQLWGMPVFRWNVLKKRKYDWWVQRLRKNLALYDVIRLDHFRAFADYWEVPAGEKTAVNGKWKPGPGASFFKTAQAELKGLPFIAEDLGDINDTVYELRDKFNLPGMKVLQFAFSENMPQSDYIPHNYTSNFFVYTGTHDNNTTRGWFRKDTGKSERKRLEQYAGRRIREKDVHEVLAQLAYASVAKTVILPFQDVLGLTEHSRMNIPASAGINWVWRLTPGELYRAMEKIHLKEWSIIYNRVTS